MHVNCCRSRRHAHHKHTHTQTRTWNCASWQCCYNLFLLLLLSPAFSCDKHCNNKLTSVCVCVCCSVCVCLCAMLLVVISGYLIPKCIYNNIIARASFICTQQRQEPHTETQTHTQRKARHNSGTQKHTHAYILANKKRVYAHNNRHILANADGSPALAMAAPAAAAAAAEGHGTGAYWLRSHKYPLTDIYTHTIANMHILRRRLDFSQCKNRPPQTANGTCTVYMHFSSLSRSLALSLFPALSCSVKKNRAE